MDTQSEETPLLSSKHEALYQRFTPVEKRSLVAMVSVCGLLPCVYYAYIIVPEDNVHFLPQFSYLEHLYLPSLRSQKT
jgi:hypothetical protein